jgi:F-type H+-transporting ATPase subunit b
MLFSVDGTFVVQLINFAIFFALVNLLFIKPVGKAIAERRRYIDSLVSDYEDATKEAGALRAQAEAKRAAARRDADVRLVAARAEIAKDVEAANADYAARASKTIATARTTVDGEIAQARSAEGRLVRELADGMLERAFATDGVR